MTKLIFVVGFDGAFRVNEKLVGHVARKVLQSAKIFHEIKACSLEVG
jgi:hypothetical protein